MAERLHAIPEMLSQTGAALADHGQSLLDLQQSCHRDADGARPGWVGSSGGALSGLLDRWATASTNHIRRFADHSAGLRSTAAGFTEMEQRNAAQLSAEHTT